MKINKKQMNVKIEKGIKQLVYKRKKEQKGNNKK
jgi:hypothetical protein